MTKTRRTTTSSALLALSLSGCAPASSSPVLVVGDVVPEVVELVTVDFDVDAFTLGRYVFMRREALTRRKIEHELVHVDQWREMGLLFAVHYIYESAKCMCYWDNPYEVAARDPGLP